MRKLLFAACAVVVLSMTACEKCYDCSVTVLGLTQSQEICDKGSDLDDAIDVISAFKLMEQLFNYRNR